MLNTFGIYLISDQPTTCPKCGSRTDFIVSKSHKVNTQIHICLNKYCSFEFITQDED